MKLISETIEDVNFITEAREDGKKNLFIEGVFLQSEIKNRNGRIYPFEVLNKEVRQYNESHISKHRAFGELGHPSSPTVGLDRVCIMIKSLVPEGKNFVGKALVLETPMGMIVKNLIEGGAILGVSSRGMGSLKQVNGVNQVQDDFQLATAADVVADPSAPDAFVNGIMEGVEFWYDDSGMLHREEIAAVAKREIEESAAKRELQLKKFQIFENYINKLSRI